MIWTPSVADIFRAYAAVYAEVPQIRDPGLLQSSVDRPKVTLFGEEQYPDIHHRAAALLDSLCRNHALIDGNKRCGWIGVRLTYFRNSGWGWVSGDDDAYDLVMEVSDTHLDVAHIAARLAAGFRPPDQHSQ